MGAFATAGRGSMDREEDFKCGPSWMEHNARSISWLDTFPGPGGRRQCPNFQDVNALGGFLAHTWQLGGDSISPALPIHLPALFGVPISARSSEVGGPCKLDWLDENKQPYSVIKGYNSNCIARR